MQSEFPISREISERDSMKALCIIGRMSEKGSLQGSKSMFTFQQDKTKPKKKLKKGAMCRFRCQKD